MVKFLIERPIAVSMCFIVALVLSTIASVNLPVSLMPDVDAPYINVYLSVDNASPRELENGIVKDLRAELMHVSHLSDIKTESKNESATVRLYFHYGSNLDYALIEVNDRIDRTLTSYPKDIPRPKVVKASVSDIPLFYLNISVKESRLQKSGSASYSKQFLDLSEFASQVILKRLEQLPEVSFVDASGIVSNEIQIIPDYDKIQSLKISTEALEKTIKDSKIDLGTLTIRDGQYYYPVRIGSTIFTKRAIEEVYIRIGTRILQLKNIARVIEQPKKPKGFVISNNANAITLAILKQKDAQVNDLKEKLRDLIYLFKKEYPSLNFEVTRDQTLLLDYSLSNLNQDLLWGSILALLIMVMFLKNIRSPLLICITMPSALLISLGSFYFFNISINIISLSGLVLGIGMMIDNSIIVIDNIEQHLNNNLPINEACIKGAEEVFVPMLSSVLTTCVVFIPLIFISGIAGALFFDEAIAVAIGAFVSLIISVTVIPVYFRLFHSLVSRKLLTMGFMNRLDFEKIYEQTFRFVFRNQKLIWTAIIVLLTAGTLTYFTLPLRKLPELSKNEEAISIDWNEQINVEENRKRVEKLLNLLQNKLTNYTALIGEQSFIISEEPISPSKVVLHVQTQTPSDVTHINKQIKLFLKNHPSAIVEFKDGQNVFNFLFDDGTPEFVAQLKPETNLQFNNNQNLRSILTKIDSALPNLNMKEIEWNESIVLQSNVAKLLVYDISPEHFYQTLRQSLGTKNVTFLNNNQNLIPIIISQRYKTLNQILYNTTVYSKNNKPYPLSEFITEIRDVELKTITAGKGGEYYPVNIPISNESTPFQIINEIEKMIPANGFIDVDFDGSFFSNKRLIEELQVILLISLALLYFIICAQFESLTMPLIILLEIPIDIAGALLLLKIFGSSINLMSLIGIVVMSGIIINDSILKIDTINRLRKEGHSLLKAIILGGRKRLKSIIMTSLTTILAMIPILMTPGIGAELQKPLALSLIGGMFVGTLVSLYFIPLCYYYLGKWSFDSPHA